MQLAVVFIVPGSVGIVPGLLAYSSNITVSNYHLELRVRVSRSCCVESIVRFPYHYSTWRTVTGSGSYPSPL